MMIYIWYIKISKSYKLGAVSSFKTLRNSEKIQEDFLLLYKFENNKSWLANKILNQLNSDQKDENTSVEENTFIGYTDSHK